MLSGYARLREQKPSSPAIRPVPERRQEGGRGNTTRRLRRRSRWAASRRRKETVGFVSRKPPPSSFALRYMRERDRVLIAGAGPVGLVVANCLADAGVPVTVFEAEPQLPENLRASTFQPPTLDMLSRFGAAQRLIEMGRVAPRLQYRDRTGWVVEFDLGVLADLTRHPYRVQCEQYKLTAVLA